MKYKQLLVLAVASATATTGWTAEKSRASKHEAIGLGSGAVIGAAAGGPIGFIVGAAFGGWVGDRFENERTGRLEAEEKYAEARAEADQLEDLLARNERELAQIAARLESERLAHARSLEEALNLQIYFRTARSEIEPGAAERLARIAQLVRSMDGAVVLLEGHADPRGDEQYNLELSHARAESVRQVFIEAGVPEERVAITAEGESRSSAATDDLDALALDRRVSISIMGPDREQRVARRSEPQH